MSTTEHEPRRPDYQEILAAYERVRKSYERDPSPRSFVVLETGLQSLVQELHRPGKFDLGQPEFLLRHKHGDWGELPPEDIRENECSLQHGARLFSASRTRRDEKLWVITEASTVRGVAEDAEDDLVLATAIAGNASFLVTGDKFLQTLGRYRNVVILSPRQFLQVLADDAGDEV